MILNGNINVWGEVQITTDMKLVDVIQLSAKKLKLKHKKQCRLFDSAGDELADEDVEYLKTGQVVFIS